MTVLITCKNEEDPIKNVGARVFTTQPFSKHSRAGNSAVHGQNSLNFELIRDLMAFLVACKNEEDPIRSEGAGAFTTSFPLLVNGDFFKRSRAANSAVHGRILLHERMKKIRSKM